MTVISDEEPEVEGADLLKEEDVVYPQKIAAEALHWDRAVEQQLALGMIPDIRRGVKQKTVLAMWDDPEMDRIMRGDVRTFIIQKASEIKGRALDLGCGVGWLSLELARNGMHVDAVDISRRRIEVARNYLAKAPKKENFGSINYMVADLNRIVLESHAYDAVVVWDALHHILEIEKLIKEVKKALKPGGNFLVLDHIGRTRLGGLMSNLFLLLLPTNDSYSVKLKSIFKSIRKTLKKEVSTGRTNADDQSPFEDITTVEMIHLINKYFSIRKKRTLLSFSAFVVPRISARDSIKYKLVRVMRLLDDFLIKLGISRGEYVFIWANKEGH